MGSVIALAGINLGPHQTMTLLGIMVPLLAGAAWIATALVVSRIILRTRWTNRQKRKEQTQLRNEGREKHEDPRASPPMQRRCG